jgi:hypothetical protein
LSVDENILLNGKCVFFYSYIHEEGEISLFVILRMSDIRPTGRYRDRGYDMGANVVFNFFNLSRFKLSSKLSKHKNARRKRE